MSTLYNLLCCGCDDSNHNESNIYGRRDLDGYEINLATFSLFGDDGEYRKFKNRRNCRDLERDKIYIDVDKWMGAVGRDYRFIAIESKQAMMDSNIPWTFPILLRNYLNSVPYNFKNIRVYIDGRLEKDDKKNILSYFPDFPNMKVCTIVKKRVGKVMPKVLKCPKVLWAADILANKIWRLGEEKLLTHEKRVAIS